MGLQKSEKKSAPTGINVNSKLAVTKKHSESSKNKEESKIAPTFGGKKPSTSGIGTTSKTLGSNIQIPRKK